MLLEEPKDLTAEPNVQKLYRASETLRKSYGLSPLVLDKECNEIAQKWAEYLADNYRFHHGGGEQIIAMGYTTPEAAVNGWRCSKGHRFWLLSNSKRVGFGCKQAKNGVWFWVGVYRQKKPEKARK
jgi:uncharacterized protein YkwD